MKVELELLKALFHSPEMEQAAIRIEGERIYRTSVGNKRYYSRKSGEKYLSLTSFLGATETNQPFLNRWRIEMGLELQSSEAADKYVQATADYGTALHTLIAEFIRKGEIQSFDVEIFALETFSGLGWGVRTIQAAIYDFVRDFAAIVQFFYDYSVSVLAVELPVFGELSGEVDANGNFARVATCIDLVVEMNEKLYTDKVAITDRKRERAIINLKSGRVVTDNHALQLAGEKALFNSLFGELVGNIETVYNLSPKDWRKEPTYTLTNQTSEHNKKRFAKMVEMGLLNGVFSMPKTEISLFSGKFVYGANPTDLLKNRPFADYFTERANQAEQADLDAAKETEA
jgi:hypothetical protein